MAGCKIMFLAMVLAVTWLSMPTEGINVPSVVTKSFFDSATFNGGCEGEHFYTHAAFLKALAAFPSFGTGTNTLAKREIAAFFAHTTHETARFCFINELAGGRYCQSTCDGRSTLYKCRPGKQYHGRGPIQLTWNCNYGACGKFLGLDLVKHPEILSTDPIASFKSALWYWMTRVHPKVHLGFAATIRAINGGECGGGNRAAVAARVKYYKQYCDKLGVTYGPNPISC